MSHEHEKIICPNCGYDAVENYCARCGQETHLHKETFWGLVMHFLGHYFHYDSKFWQTMNALWFSPGKLTIAYWNKQRMRYLPPISLYIFISAVYFLVSSQLPVANEIQVTDRQSKKGVVFTNSLKKDDVDINKDTAIEISGSAIGDNKDITASTGFGGWINGKFNLLKQKHEDPQKFMNEAAEHNLPKLFFFMIPVMAMLLKLLYAKRKDLFFVDHAIFALHFHSFLFSIFMLKFPFALKLFNLSGTHKALITAVLGVIAMVYMIRALRKVYGSGRGKAIFYTLTLAWGYSIFLGILYLLDVLLILCTA